MSGPMIAGDVEALAARLRDLLDGSREVAPYKHGDDVGGYCGKVAHVVTKSVRMGNHNNPDSLMVFCETTSCSCSRKVSDLPTRYRVSRQTLEHEAAKALPRLLAALAHPSTDPDG